MFMGRLRGGKHRNLPAHTQGTQEHEKCSKSTSSVEEPYLPSPSRFVLRSKEYSGRWRAAAPVAAWKLGSSRGRIGTFRRTASYDDSAHGFS